MSLHPDAMTRFCQLLDELHDLARGAEPKPAEKRISTMVGLSMGEHEEVADANYARQPVTFVQDPFTFMWVNKEPVFFPQAVGAHAADSIIIDGGEVRTKMVARMASPVWLSPGHGVGFAATKLSVTPDVMQMATRKADAPFEMPRAAYDGPLAPPTSHDSIAQQFADAIRQNEKARERAERTKDFDTLDEMQKHGLLSASGLNPAPEREPEETTPLYCDHCERITVQRRNQFVSMGHQVSHLVELPNEQGYALPCKSCRK